MHGFRNYSRVTRLFVFFAHLIHGVGDFTKRCRAYAYGLKQDIGVALLCVHGKANSGHGFDLPLRLPLGHAWAWNWDRLRSETR